MRRLGVKDQSWKFKHSMHLTRPKKLIALEFYPAACRRAVLFDNSARTTLTSSRPSSAVLLDERVFDDYPARIVVRHDAGRRYQAQEIAQRLP
jgi:hypothetical protein